MKRFFVVFDADYAGDTFDVATWLECAVATRDAPKTDITVYDNLDDLLSDHKERLGAFEVDDRHLLDGVERS